MCCDFIKIQENDHKNQDGLCTGAQSHSEGLARCWTIVLNTCGPADAFGSRQHLEELDLRSALGIYHQAVFPNGGGTEGVDVVLECGALGLEKVKNILEMSSIVLRGAENRSSEGSQGLSESIYIPPDVNSTSHKQMCKYSARKGKTGE